MPRLYRSAVALLAAMPRLLSRMLLPSVLIIFLAPFIALLFYSSPAADDFCEATLSFASVPQPSVLSVTWLYYTKWSPRWLTTFIVHSVLSHVNLPPAYGWLLLAIIVANVAALGYFFSATVRLTRTQSLLVATVFYAAWIASISNPDEQLYWFSDVIVYNLPLSTMLVLAGLLQRARRRVWYYAAIVLLSIAVPAEHEIAGTFLCSALFAATVITRMKKLKVPQLYLSFAMAALSFATVMLSPGNAARASAEHRPLWDTAHSLRWVAHSFYNGFNWLSLPAILVAACCILVLSQPGQKAPAVAGVPPRWLAIASVFGMFVVLCVCSVTEVATSMWLAPRVVSWFQFVFWLLFICAVMTGIPELYETRFSPGTRIGVFTLLAVTLLGSSSFRAAVQDLHGPAQSWRRTYLSRLVRRGGAIEFDAPSQYPKLAKPQMLAADPGCWANRCLANYLHADSVIVRNSPDRCP
jgi:hypothetical protein